MIIETREERAKQGSTGQWAQETDYWGPAPSPRDPRDPAPQAPPPRSSIAHSPSPPPKLPAYSSLHLAQASSRPPVPKLLKTMCRHSPVDFGLLHTETLR